MLLACQIAVGIAIAVTTGGLIMHSHEQALAQAGLEQQRFSRVLADQAERAFETVELVQTDLARRLDHDGVNTASAFRDYMSSDIIHGELRLRGRMLPQLDAINVVDRDGNLINSSRLSPGPSVNVADRDYYRTLKADRERTTFISAPVRNRTNGKLTAYIAHRVSAPDGEFLGLILGSVRLAYFEELYRAVSPGPGSSIGLRLLNGVFLAHDPHFDIEAQQPLAEPGALGSWDVSADDGVAFRRMSPIDGVERIVADRALRHYPLVVGVTRTVSSILAAWREHTADMAGTTLLVECMLAGVGLLTLRQLRGQRLLHEARVARAEAEAARSGAEAELVVAHERERAGQALRTQNIRFEAALNNMSQALFMFDSADRVIVMNSRASEMFGLKTAGVAIGMELAASIQLLASKSTLAASDVESMRDSVMRMKTAGKRETHLRELADGRAMAVNFAPIENEGWLVTLEDITERRIAEARITHMAHHDALTELPNRVLFHARLHEAIARGHRGERCAVLYLDLDNFKDVNDTLGHPAGDALLREVTHRLRAQVRETDTVARLGGDEFAIVQSSVDQPRDARALAERLIETFLPQYDIAGHQVPIGTSIGIAIVPDDGDDADQIMKNADLALYSAKSNGRGRYCFFEPGMDALMQARRSLEMDLRKALMKGEFELYYQPLMNIKSASITGFEALLRWWHPERGLVQPLDFIPLAEEIGLIVPLGAWALRQACLDAMTWPADMKVAVNVSVIQFDSGTLVDGVADALRESGLNPARLELEIVESVMLNDTESTLAILYQLRDLGVGIAMDDFGTGYSSLSYLRRFPFSKVKIDRSFIADLGKAGGGDAIVTAVTELCETLGMSTLAEGVETDEQLRLLRAGHCGEAQGYLFSPPRPADEVAALCARLSGRVLTEAAD